MKMKDLQLSECSGKDLLFGCPQCIDLAHEGQRQAKLLKQDPEKSEKIYIEKVLYAQCPHCDYRLDADYFLINNEDDLINKLTIKVNDRRFCKQKDCGKELYY